MISKEELDEIVKEYYNKIYNFCYSQLKDIHAAKDCTQETFYIFLKKRASLYNSDRISSWIYNTAEKVIMKYKKKHSLFISIENIDNDVLDKTYHFDKDLIDEIYSILSKEEADLLIRYFNADHGERNKISDELGITLIALYKKVARIRKKLADKIDKEELLHL